MRETVIPSAIIVGRRAEALDSRGFAGPRTDFAFSSPPGATFPPNPVRTRPQRKTVLSQARPRIPGTQPEQIALSHSHPTACNHLSRNDLALRSTNSERGMGIILDKV